IPALLTRPCKPPSFSAASTARAQSAAEVTSCRTKDAAGPSSTANDWPRLSSTSPMTTFAPCATSRRASAAPWPRAPPLTRTTLLSKRAISAPPIADKEVWQIEKPGPTSVDVGSRQVCGGASHFRDQELLVDAVLQPSVAQ